MLMTFLVLLLIVLIVNSVDITLNATSHTIVLILYDYIGIEYQFIGL